MAIDIGREIERLLQFGLSHELIEQEDVRVVRNGLLDLFRLAEPASVDEKLDIPDSPVPILDRMLDYAAEHGLMEDHTTTQRDLLDARIMGLFMPRQSELTRTFWSTYKEQSPEAATKAYYAMSQASNYIRMDRIARNLYWRTATPYGELEITVNLSKPEKDPKEIAAERSAPKSHYPKCLLCPENAGYAGRVNHPARQNHRTVPLTLEGNPWYMQYSPYVYYNEHCIVFSEAHTPMSINDRSFVKLLEFVAQFPHYFVGSNADLPIVGGSILSHDHFQGGRHTFPMELATMERSYSHPDAPGVKVGIVKWPMSVIRLAGADRSVLISMASAILRDWRTYSDPEADILAHSEVQGERTPHNTITPIARMNKEGLYELDLVLRNNRTSEEHPDGIFHPHQELHHIKKENIGLIEVMGLAVLPGRLQEELSELQASLTGAAQASFDEWDASHPLFKHKPWIEGLVREHGQAMSEPAARDLLEREVGHIFLEVLTHAGVYKQDERGLAAFDRFLSSAGYVSK